MLERTVLVRWLMPIRSVLCPLDFSEGSRAALHAAWRFVRQFDGVLHVLFVEHPLLAAAAREASIGHDLTEELAQFVAETPGQEGPPQPVLHVLTGDPADVIVALADRERVDAIVIGTHGLTGIRKAFFGSTTARVLRRTTRPVLMAPLSGWSGQARDLEGLGSILVLTDFGRAATRAARAAARLARAIGGPLVLVHVIPPISAPSSWGPAAAAAIERREGDAHRQMCEAMAALRRDGPVESVIVEGNIADRAAELAHTRHAGLIVMGLDSDARGAHPGSTAYNVMCRAPVPVLAIADGVEGGL